ncbi:hypothetical protein HY375_01895 [Candidatus Berkelbacteria bacterium]|nr:hypothetical protein [Candidatus Berkelbacteria bacterium]
MTEVNGLTKLVGAYRPTRIEPFLLRFLQLADAQPLVGEIELDEPTTIKPPREESVCWFEHEGSVALTVTVEIASERHTTHQVARLYAAGSKKRGIVLLGPLEHRMVELAAAHGVTYRGRHRQSQDRKSEADPKALKRLEDLMLRLREEVSALGPANLDRITKVVNELVRRVAALEKVATEPRTDEGSSGHSELIERLARKVEGRSDDTAALQNQVGRLAEELNRQGALLRGQRAPEVEISSSPTALDQFERAIDRLRTASQWHGNELGQLKEALEQGLGELSARLQVCEGQLVEWSPNAAAEPEPSNWRLEVELALAGLTARIDALVVDRNVAEDDLRSRVVTLEIRLAEQAEAFQIRLAALEARQADATSEVEEQEDQQEEDEIDEDVDPLHLVLFAVYRCADDQSITTNRRNWDRCLWRKHLLPIPVSQLVRDLRERLRSWNGKPVTEAVAEQLYDYLPQKVRRYAKRQAVLTVARCIVDGFFARGLGKDGRLTLDDEDAVAAFTATLVTLDD